MEFKEKTSRAYFYSWGDEFDSSGITDSKWLNSYPWGRHLRCNPEVNFYSDGDDLSVMNGVLSIQARKAPIRTKAIPYEKDDFILNCPNKPPAANLMDFDYQSGMIYSKEKFKYGHFEIRFKTDASSGHWPAFWLFGADNQEIDIFEIGAGKLREVHVDVHCKNGCNNYPVFLGLLKKNWGGYLKTNASWPNEFHTMAVTWEPEGVTWFLDDHPIAWWKGDFHEPLALIANLAVANVEGSLGGKILPSTPFPAHFEIDYIRVWQETFLADNKLTANTSFVRAEEQKKAKITKKNRPMYKRSKLKESFEKCYIYLDGQQNLFIQRIGNLADPLNIKIVKENKIILEKEIGFKSASISLKSIPLGTYQLQLSSRGITNNIALEVP